MATLGELKSRIIRETARAELADAEAVTSTDAFSGTLSDAITQAIRHYADKRFFFNESRVIGSTVAGVATVARPAGLRSIETLSVTVGGSAYGLCARGYPELQAWAEQVITNGQPTDYAENGGLIHLYPTPNAVYPLSYVGTVDVTAPADDDASNSWTTDGEDLIASRARMILCRDYFRDADGVILAQQAERDALSTLRTRTTQRSGGGRVRTSW